MNNDSEPQASDGAGPDEPGASPAASPGASPGDAVHRERSARHLSEDPAESAEPADVPAAGPAAEPVADRPAGKRIAHHALGWAKEILTIVVIAVVLSFLVKTFLFRAFYIPSGSMENTLKIDDRIFVSLLVPKPIAIERGDVVVFKDSQGWLGAVHDVPVNWLTEVGTFIGLLPDNSQQHLVKRVIGLPGDKVMCCDADGKMTINGRAVTEPYLYPGASPSDSAFDVIVPQGHLWVMGDHRNNSQDSRYHDSSNGTGFVPIDDVEGRALVIAWPLSHWGTLGNYPDVFTNVPDPQSTSVSSPQPVSAGQ